MDRFTVMTFNVRYDEESDDDHAWLHRRAIALATIRAHSPDLMGLQEPSAPQWADIASVLHGWLPFGVTREESNGAEIESQGGFIRENRFHLLDSGQFWLSDTPAVPNSVSWPNDWGPRSCAWARLRDRRVDRDLVFACTHLDTNAAAWLPSAKMLHRQLDRIAGENPIVLVGDFNCVAGNEAHVYLCVDAGFRDAWTEAGHADEGVLTYNGFTPYTHLPGNPEELQAWLERTSQPVAVFGHYPPHVLARDNYRIDWILFRGPIECLSAINDYRNDRGLLPSDHYPVIGTLEWLA